MTTSLSDGALRDTLEEWFDYTRIWQSTTSNAVFEGECYQFVINHASIDTSGIYYCSFDVFLRDDTLRLWLEGTMIRTNIKFDGTSICDAPDLSYSFEVLCDEISNDSHEEKQDLFSGKELSEANKSPEIKKLLGEVLHEDTLNSLTLWSLNFISFVKGINYCKSE